MENISSPGDVEVAKKNAPSVIADEIPFSPLHVFVLLFQPGGSGVDRSQPIRGEKDASLPVARDGSEHGQPHASTSHGTENSARS